MKANTTTVKSRKDGLLRIFVYPTAIALFFLILFSSLNHMIFNSSFYETKFQELGVYDRFGSVKADAEKEILLDYFNNDDKIIQSEFYNEKEKQHLVDVKSLILISKTIFYFLSIFLIAFFLFVYLKRNVYFFKFISKVFMLAGALIIISSLAAYFLQDNFSQLFYNFHLLLFSNKLWLLDPTTDNLISLFPEQFFFDIVKQTMIVFVIVGSLFFIEGLRNLISMKNQNTNHMSKR